jgi:hypothetical protein
MFVKTNREPVLMESHISPQACSSGFACWMVGTQPTEVGRGTIRDIRQDTTEKHDLFLAQSCNEPAYTDFSSVGSSEADGLLGELGLLEVLGNATHPIIVPEGTPEATSFDYSVCTNENDWTSLLLQHHQEQLKKYAVPFGRNGYQMYDMHARGPLYSITTRLGQVYAGAVDGCLGPYGLSPASAARSSRVVFEHKQSAESNRCEQFKVRALELHG